MISFVDDAWYNDDSHLQCFRCKSASGSAFDIQSGHWVTLCALMHRMNNRSGQSHYMMCMACRQVVPGFDEGVLSMRAGE